MNIKFGMGSIFYDEEFQFPDDGPPADKLLVLLNEPSIQDGEPYIFVWTTSQWPRTVVGCRPELQQFFIPAGADIFEKDTHICLHRFVGATDLDYGAEHYKGSLTNQTMGQLVNCIKITPDVPEEYWPLIQNSWKRICKTNKATKKKKKRGKKKRTPAY